MLALTFPSYLRKCLFRLFLILKAFNERFQRIGKKQEEGLTENESRTWLVNQTVSSAIPEKRDKQWQNQLAEKSMTRENMKKNIKYRNR